MKYQRILLFILLKVFLAELVFQNYVNFLSIKQLHSDGIMINIQLFKLVKHFLNVTMIGE